MADQRKLIQIVISGVVALVFVNFYLKGREQHLEGGYVMIDVLAAAKDIPSRTEIRPDQLTTKRVPQKYMEPGSIIIKVPGTEYDKVKQKVTIAGILSGATITYANLNDPDMNKGGIAPHVALGKRAYLLRLGNLDVQQLVLPRDRIDILATLPIGNNRRGTYTVLQNILVIAVGKDIIRPEETSIGKSNTGESLVLTLAVTPLEAQQLDWVRKESDGEISVTVRAQNDNTVQPIPGIGPEGLIHTPAPQPQKR